MFGFGKKKPVTGVKCLSETRDDLRTLVGLTMDVYVGTVVGHLLNIGNKTDEDVKRTKARMLENLQKYVQAEVLLDRQNHGQKPDLAELARLLAD